MLAWAAWNGHLQVVIYLLEQGANPFALNHKAILWALRNNHLDVAGVLIDYGYGDNPNKYTFGDEALNWAIDREQWDVVKYLIDHDVPITDEFIKQKSISTLFWEESYRS